MHAAEATVAHDQNLIARPRRRDHCLDEFCQLIEGLGLCAERRQHLG